MHVALVEPHPGLCDALHWAFCLSGDRVTVVDGSHLEQVVVALCPDLLLLEPGSTVTDEQVQTVMAAGIPILVIGEHLSSEALARRLHLPFLAKPFRITQLMRLIQLWRPDAGFISLVSRRCPPSTRLGCPSKAGARRTVS